jgi:uracil-DNA glycosylase
MNFSSLRPALIKGRTKEERLESIKRQASICQMCPEIVKERRNVVFGEGDPDAALMIVGEAPGAREDETGRPFVGAAGQLLTRVIQALGVERRDVYIANVLKCRPNTRPGETNRKPTRPEMLDCAPYLLAQIKVVEPVAIVALGATAMEALGIDEGVSTGRGRWYRFDAIPLTATFHPAYVLRNPTIQVRRQFWQDIKEAWESCGLSAEEDNDWVPEIGT